MAEHSLWWAVGCCLATQLANSFCDAIKFSCQEAARRHDRLWHGVKWLVDRPCLWLAGYFSFRIVAKQQLVSHDLWHYSEEFLVLAFAVAISFFVWQLNYRFWSNYFKR